MPGFEAECDQCHDVRRFEEFTRERRVAKGEMAAARGDYKMDREFSFRCSTCGWRTEKIVDTSGVLHKMSGAKHQTWKV